MKINVEIECTPAEARAAIGFPDLTPLHDKYVSMMMETMQGGVPPEMMESLMKSWAPMGEAGMSFWQRMFDGATKP